MKAILTAVALVIIVCSSNDPDVYEDVAVLKPGIFYLYSSMYVGDGENYKKYYNLKDNSEFEYFLSYSGDTNEYQAGKWKTAIKNSKDTIVMVSMNSHVIKDGMNTTTLRSSKIKDQEIAIKVIDSTYFMIPGRGSLGGIGGVDDYYRQK